MAVGFKTGLGDDVHRELLMEGSVGGHQGGVGDEGVVDPARIRQGPTYTPAVCWIFLTYKAKGSFGGGEGANFLRKEIAQDFFFLTHLFVKHFIFFARFCKAKVPKML